MELILLDLILTETWKFSQPSGSLYWYQAFIIKNWYIKDKIMYELWYTKVFALWSPGVFGFESISQTEELMSRTYLNFVSDNLVLQWTFGLIFFLNWLAVKISFNDISPEIFIFSTHCFIFLWKGLALQSFAICERKFITCSWVFQRLQLVYF